MDTQVLAAMARWPNVPDVYGWLSLSPVGQWRLHPRGTGWRDQADPLVDLSADDILGEAITSPQITSFINRNYTSDPAGRWYFQNGPQRVHVRLDAAPYLLRTDRDAQGRLTLRTHTGTDAGQVSGWWLDEHGRMFARTAVGPGMIAGRDLQELVDTLNTSSGPLSEVLADSPPALEAVRILPWPEPDRGAPVALLRIAGAELPAALGFVTYPRPDPSRA